MARYVIDAPTLLHLVSDAPAPCRPEHQLVAPNAIRSEVMALLLADVRAGRRSDRDALGLHTRVTELKLRLLGDRVSRATAWRLARELDWDSFRDAEYLAITKLQADALVTVDAAFAARAAAVVPVESVDALFAE